MWYLLLLPNSIKEFLIKRGPFLSGVIISPIATAIFSLLIGLIIYLIGGNLSKCNIFNVGCGNINKKYGVSYLNAFIILFIPLFLIFYFLTKLSIKYLYII